MKKGIPKVLSLCDKHIWVIGGAGYLGQTTVLMLEALGANVLCIDMKNLAQEFIQSFKLDPDSNVTSATLDVRQGKEIKGFVAQRIEAHGVPWGLVNLAFVSTAKKMEDISEEEFDEVNHGGLTSKFLLSREIGLEMVKVGGGSIVLFSSMYGMVSPVPEIYEKPLIKNPIEYGVGKAGLIQMTRYHTVHWGRDNVR